MSSLRREKFGLPLLQRELTELSARPRTFLTRAVYAVVFFGLIGWQFGEQFSRSNADALLDLGRGRQLFDQLVLWQLGGVSLFMPILTSGAIASEKERGTLSLLMITHLSPMLILIEKLGSRIFVMFTLLLLAVPVTAYAYSMGGIEPIQIAGSFVVLISTTVYVGAFTLVCSSFCNSAAGAVISSFIFGLPFVLLTSGFVLPAISSSGGLGMWITAVVTQMFFTFAFLSVARKTLAMRLEQAPGNLGLEFLRWLDRVWERLNTKYARGVIVAKERQSLPGDQPVTWRESSRKSLGSFRYLLRVFIVIEVPTLVILVIAGPQLDSEVKPTTGLLWTVWILACLVITARVSGVIASERTRQTLDVVLATPMTGRDIVKQHAAGLRKLILVLSAPILTCSLFPLMSYPKFNGQLLLSLFSSTFFVLIYLPLCTWSAMIVGLMIRSQLKAVITATLVLGLWCLAAFLPHEDSVLAPLRLFSVVPAFAILATSVEFIVAPRGGSVTPARVAVIGLRVGGLLVAGYATAAWIFESWQWPLSMIVMPEIFHHPPGLGILLSPAVLPVDLASLSASALESRLRHDHNTLGLVLINFAWYGFLLMLARAICLRKADAWLGRGG